MRFRAQYDAEAIITVKTSGKVDPKIWNIYAGVYHTGDLAHSINQLHRMGSARIGLDLGSGFV